LAPKRRELDAQAGLKWSGTVNRSILTADSWKRTFRTFPFLSKDLSKIESTKAELEKIETLEDRNRNERGWRLSVNHLIWYEFAPRAESRRGHECFFERDTIQPSSDGHRGRNGN
jgi:hypothetical protein